MVSVSFYLERRKYIILLEDKNYVMEDVIYASPEVETQCFVVVVMLYSYLMLWRCLGLFER